MTIVTICWNWAQALNHTVILENVTRPQRIYIRIMIFYSIHIRTNARTHTCMCETKCHAFGKYWCWHKHRSDTNMSARGFSLIVWVNFRIYYFGNNTSGQTKHQKSHTSILLWKSDVQYTVIVLQCCCLQPLFNLALHVNVERLLVLARFLVNSHHQNYPIDRTETVHQT